MGCSYRTERGVLDFSDSQGRASVSWHMAHGDGDPKRSRQLAEWLLVKFL